MERHNEFQIAMVGAFGVGKTSLLAAMYDEIDQEIEKTNGRVVMPSGPMRQQLLDRLKELKNMANQDVVVDGEQGVGRTAQEKRYCFDFFWEQTTDPELSLTFIDLPGGWYHDAKRDEEAMQEATSILSSSHASILAIDSVALMDPGLLKGKHEQINKPNEIREVYKEAIQGFDKTHSVIITLIRSESFQEEELFEEVKIRYARLIKTLKLNEVNVYLGTVETVGSLQFESYDLNSDFPRATFSKTRGESFKPERCAVPLRIILSNTVTKILDEEQRSLIERSLLQKLWDFAARHKQIKARKETVQRLERILAKLEGRNSGGFIEC